MLETEISEDYSFLAWFAQQVGALLVPSILALLTAGPIANYFEHGRGYPLGVLGETIWYALFVWGIGLYVALLVARLFPSSVITGRWVWPVPTLFFLLFFVRDALFSSFGHALSDLFYPGPNGEAWWGVMIVTYPTCSAALYALGMFFAANQRARGKETRLG